MSAITQADMEKYPIQDWKHWVANGDTVLGYLDWVEHSIECHPRQCEHCQHALELVDDKEDADGDEDHWSSPNGCHPDCPACAAHMHWQCTNPECPSNKAAMGSEENVITHFSKT